MPATERFATTVTMDRWPFCPACGKPLAPDGVTFRHGLAYCTLCAETDVIGVYKARAALLETELHRYVTVRAGLHWYAFHEPETRGYSANDLLTRLTGRRIGWDPRHSCPTLIEPAATAR